MDTKILVIFGLVVVIVALVMAFLFVNVIKLPAPLKYKSAEEVTSATVEIGSGVEKVGSTLEEIDRSLK